MKAIVVVDKNWGIGKDNGLLFHLPEDMRHFKEYTDGKVIVMGANTLLSFPNASPLKNRTNIILWPDGEDREGVIIVRSLKELSSELKKYNNSDTFIVGGAMFYKTMLPYCSEVIVTKIDADGKASVFFENLDNLENFIVTLEGKTLVSKSGYNYRFLTYTNNTVKPF